ncbi:hypothetical protein, partial [Xanthomonas fragariae]
MNPDEEKVRETLRLPIFKRGGYFGDCCLIQDAMKLDSVVPDLERLTKPLESCLAGGKIADMTRRKEIPIALWKRIEPLIPQVKR